MQDNLAASGRKLVTIIDPHIKRDPNYYIYKEAQDKGLYVLNKDKQEFDGSALQCYVDALLPAVHCFGQGSCVSCVPSPTYGMVIALNEVYAATSCLSSPSAFTHH